MLLEGSDSTISRVTPGEISCPSRLVTRGRMPEEGRPPLSRAASWRMRHCQPMNSRLRARAAALVRTTLSGFSDILTSDPGPIPRQWSHDLSQFLVAVYGKILAPEETNL